MADTKTDAEKAVGKLPDGWVLVHAQEPRAVTAKSADGSATIIHEGNYVAMKRQPGSDTPAETQAETPELLKQRIEEWERRQPVEPGAQTLSEEMLLESAKATVHMAVTASARQSLDVDLTPASKKSDAKAANVSSNPPVEVTKLDKEDAALVAAGTAATPGKVDGVGGVGPASTPG